MSVSVKLADALVTRLNMPADPPLSQSFTAVRQYVPVFDLEKATGIQVAVVPKSVEVTKATRDSAFFDCAVDIAVQKKLGNNMDEEADGLMTLVEEIIDHIGQGPLADYPAAAWLSTENAPIFAPEHMNEKRAFTSLITVTYRIRR
jgi:hypothetical protein